MTNDLESIAEHFDSIYVRLQSSEMMFSTELANESYVESLQSDIDTVCRVGIGIEMPMTSCSHLFEQLNEGCPSIEQLRNARAELNCLIVRVRQLANDPQTEVETSKFPGFTQLYREMKSQNPIASYKQIAIEYRRTLDRNDKTTAETLKRWLERPGNH